MPRLINTDQLKYIRRNILAKLRRRDKPGGRRIADTVRLKSELRAIDAGIERCRLQDERLVRRLCKDGVLDPHRKDG